MAISYLGVRTDGRTDRHGFGILIWKHVGTQKISTQSSKLGVSCRSLYASPEVGMHNYACPVILVAVIKVGDITVPVISVVVICICILDTNLMLIYDRQIIINY